MCLEKVKYILVEEDFKTFDLEYYLFLYNKVGQDTCDSKIWFVIFNKNISYMHQFKCCNTTDYDNHITKVFVMKQVLGDTPLSIHEIILGLDLTFFQVQGDSLNNKIHTKMLEILQEVESPQDVVRL